MLNLPAASGRFDTRDLTPHIGSEISGLDLTRSLTQTTLAALLQQLDTRGVVVVRGQRLTADQFVAFSASLGTLHANPSAHGMPRSHVGGSRHWQSDGAHLRTPHRATLLYAVEIAEKEAEKEAARDGAAAGDTVFASTSAACDALEPALRQQLRAMRAIHLPLGTRKKRAAPFYLDSALTQGFQRRVEHPVVRAHPHTGRQCLYVNPASTSHIRGMNDTDSDVLLAQLYQHITRAEFVYHHAWQAGDLVLWDNCSTQHRTECDDILPQQRLMYRTIITGHATR